ncbi:hypothetical protein JCM3775_004795 [Rhodotorula graminis]
MPDAPTLAARRGQSHIGTPTRPPPRSRPHSHHRRRFRPSKATLERGWTHASFHFSLAATFLAIGIVWVITPLAWAYVLWTLVTLHPKLASSRPAPATSSTSPLRILHWCTFAYCVVECVFSVGYRLVAIRCNALRTPHRHGRKYLRALFLRSLENGLDLDADADDSSPDDDDDDHVDRTDKRKGASATVQRASGTDKLEDDWAERARDEEEAQRGSDSDLPATAGTGVKAKKGRRRAAAGAGDGASTPELGTADLPSGAKGGRARGSSASSDYLSARVLPVLRTDDPSPRAPSSSSSSSRMPTRSTSRHLAAAVEPSRSRSSLDSRDEGFGGDMSRLSLRTLDSALGASPRSTTAPVLPLVAPTAGAAPSYPPSSSAPVDVHAAKKQHAHPDGHPHPHTRFLPRLSPTDPRALEFRELLRFWFGGCDFDAIGRLNMADWLAWSMYGCPLEELEDERREWDKAGRPVLTTADGAPDRDSDVDESGDEGSSGDDDVEERVRARRTRTEESVEADRLGLVHHCLVLVQARAAHVFPPGRNPAVKPLRLTLDPVRVTSRPFLLYLVVFLLQKSVMGIAMARGFKKCDDQGTRYLVKIPEGWSPREDAPEDEKPLVFIHGLGMGLAQYTTLVSVLSKSRAVRNRPILVLLQPHISMSIFSPGYLDPVEQEDCAAGLDRVLRKHGFDERAGGCTVLSHSNGSIVHGWLLKQHPNLVARSCFVDPVAFQLYEPWVCYNALYAPAKKPMEHLMRYFVMRELGVSFMLSRTFSWTSNLLWPHEIPSHADAHKTAVFLASDDSILSAERVRVYLRRNGMREVRAPRRVGDEPGGGGLKVFEGLKHGESMIGEGAPFEEVMRWVTWDGRDPTAYEVGASGSSSEAPESTARRA